MKASSSQLVVLDTTVIVHLARDSPTGRAIETQYALTSRSERPLLSTVVEGEILALARGWGWGQTKMAQLNALLLELVRVDAGMREIVQAYAELYYEATRSGKPRGENDLWIAATAQATGGALFTRDTDFAWMHPDFLAVCCIPEVR